MSKTSRRRKRVRRKKRAEDRRLAKLSAEMLRTPRDIHWYTRRPGETDGELRRRILEYEHARSIDR